MGYFNIDYSQFKPSSKTDTTKQSVSDRLEQNLKKLNAPRPSVQQDQKFNPNLALSTKEKPGFFKRPLVKKVVDILNYPAYKTEQFLTGGRGYEKALEDPKFRSRYATILSIPSAGIGRKTLEKSLENPTARKIAAFGTQLVADPLNFIPISAIAGKVDDVTKISSRTSNLLNKLDDIPKFTELRNSLGTKFIRGYGLPEAYNTLKSEVPTKLGVGAKKIVENVSNAFSEYGDLSDEAKDAVAKFLEPNGFWRKVDGKMKFIQGAGYGEDLGALRRTLEASGEWEKIRPMLTEARKILDQEVVDLVQRGRMTGDVAKDLLTRGGYFPHTDFAPNSLKKYFGRGRELGVKNFYLKGRKGAKGFTYNAPKAISKRELAQFQDNVVQDFLKQVKESFGYKVGKSNPVREGFYWFDEKTPKQLIELKGWALPQKIADDLLAIHGTNNMLTRAIDRFNKYWKPTATAFNPSFHFMNIIGNLFNSWLGGVKDPRRFLQSIAGNFDEGERAILESSGILARGQFGADVVNKAFTDVDTLRLLSQFDTPITRNLKRLSPRQIGEFFENNARSAFFLNSREKFLANGLDELTATRKAIQETNKYLFDYLSGLTPFETNIMRRFFPFYTWARFNIPLQLQSIITKPEKYTPLTKLYETLNKGYDVPEDEQGFGFPTPFVDGNGDPIRWVPNLPVNDIFSLNRSRFINMLNPIIKDGIPTALWAIGGASPVDTYTGRPRTNTDLPLTEQIKDIFSPTSPGSLPQSLLRPVRSTTQFGDPNRTTESILDVIIGGFYTTSKDRQIMKQLYEKEGRNSAIRYKIRQIQNNPRLTIEQKRNEIDRLLKLME